MLTAATPQAWIELALHRWQDLLIDHANCEKKAASTALSLMFAYPDDRRLAQRLARLAREELRHFEQVDRLLQQLDVPPRRMAAGRYAGELRRAVANHEPQRKVDLMLTGALIEARSCERFECLAPLLPAPLGEFYGDLAVAERRHHELYLQLAEQAADWGRQSMLFSDDQEPTPEEHIAQRLAVLSAVEADLVTRTDTQFRFHSGPPA